MLILQIFYMTQYVSYFCNLYLCSVTYLASRMVLLRFWNIAREVKFGKRKL